MKTKGRQQKVIGSYCLVRQKTKPEKWLPGEPSSMYNPTWLVKLRLPGDGQAMRSSGVSICKLCLAVKPEDSPARLRPECRCQKEAQGAASGLLNEEVEKWRNKRQSEEEEARLAVAEPTIARVLKVYSEHVPLRGRRDYLKRGERLCAIVAEATGQEAGPQLVSVLTWRLVLEWARLRQESFRRGWNVRGGVPAGIANPWAVLRTELQAGKLPPLDKETVMACNTTIKSYLVAARTVVGPTSRSEYLLGLTLPPLTEFLTGKVRLPSPVGHQSMEEAAYARLYAGSARLKEENLQLWVVDQMLWRFGCRPIEAAMSRDTWVEHDEVGPIFVLRNRPEEAPLTSGTHKGETFALKARHRAIERRLRIAPDLWEAMQVVMVKPGALVFLRTARKGRRPGMEKVQVKHGSLIGAQTGSQAERLVARDHSFWLRSYIDEPGQHSNYLLRHYVGAKVRAKYGTEVAAAWLGHATGATLRGGRAGMTESRYADHTEILPALALEDIAP